MPTELEERGQETAKAFMKSRLTKGIERKDGLHVGVAPPLDTESGFCQASE
jgi:hypothetical protein